MLAHHHEQSRDMADAQCVVTCPLAQAILSHPEGASPALSTLRVEFEEAVAPWRGVVSSPRPPPPR